MTSVPLSLPVKISAFLIKVAFVPDSNRSDSSREWNDSGGWGVALSNAQRDRMACFASALNLKFGVTAWEGSTKEGNPENFVNVQNDVDTITKAVATAMESTTAAKGA